MDEIQRYFLVNGRLVPDKDGDIILVPALKEAVKKRILKEGSYGRVVKGEEFINTRARIKAFSLVLAAIKEDK